MLNKQPPPLCLPHNETTSRAIKCRPLRLGFLWLALLPAGMAAPLFAQEAARVDQQEPNVTGSLKDRALSEVVVLHDFLSDWFSGALPKTKAAFARFDDAIASDFLIISPDGSISHREPVLAAVFNDWGRWLDDPEAHIEVKHPHFRQQGSKLLVVTYEEWQFSRAGRTKRTSTVVLRESERGPLGLQWVHLHETWLQLNTKGE